VRVNTAFNKMLAVRGASVSGRQLHYRGDRRLPPAAPAAIHLSVRSEDLGELRPFS